MYPENQKPQPKASPSPPAGASFTYFGFGALVAIRFKVKTSMNLSKYTAEQISEIIDRITTLRMRWLRHIDTQLESQQSRAVLDHYKLSGEPAE